MFLSSNICLVSQEDVLLFHYRDSSKRLANHNELLQSQMRQVELDTLDVITFLKGQDQKKDAQVGLSRNIYFIFKTR